MKMSARYGVDATCSDTKIDLIDLITQGNGPIEICGIINILLDKLYEKGVKVIDGDNPKWDFLESISYDEETDELYFWTGEL